MLAVGWRRPSDVDDADLDFPPPSQPATDLVSSPFPPHTSLLALVCSVTSFGVLVTSLVSVCCVLESVLGC
jgi:hypothetical protein